jgi:hypothetical protein
MVAVSVAVAAHVAELGHLLHGATPAILVGVLVLVFFVGSELGNGGSELADLCGYQCEFGILALAGFTHVGYGIVVCDRCAGDLGNVVLDLVADVGHAVGAFVAVAPGRASAAVLDVCVVGFDTHLEIILGERVVGLGGNRLLLPFHHFCFVEYVGVLHLLQIELEFVLARYGDVGAHE